MNKKQLETDNFHDNESTDFSPLDIIWFKNVTDKEYGEAYLDCKDIFTLNFPLKHRTNILSPKINEIIILYQKVYGTPCFTHLVTPISNIEIDENIISSYRYGRKVKVIAKTNKENIIPVSSTLWKNISLQGFTQGNACKIENIKALKNSNKISPDDIQYDIWQKFSPFFIKELTQSIESVSAVINNLKITNPDFSVKEGDLKLVSHLIRERNKKIIRDKKNLTLNNNLKCEVCEFSFIETFEVPFIECHHITPISLGTKKETTLDDLALVCSNCHRMLHRKFNEKYLSIEELKMKRNSKK